VPGRAREVRQEDREVVLPWFSAFEQEAAPGDPFNPDAWFNSLFGSEARTLLVWEVGGELVSMAGAVGFTPHGARVSWVYTPSALRGRGYGSAVVAALSQRLLELGRRFCFLYADLANPAANKIYQRIGYRQVIDTGVYHFE
jgi:predicted GNAT family acetyltransferase